MVVANRARVLLCPVCLFNNPHRCPFERRSDPYGRPIRGSRVSCPHFLYQPPVPVESIDDIRTVALQLLVVLDISTGHLPMPVTDFNTLALAHLLDCWMAQDAR